LRVPLVRSIIRRGQLSGVLPMRSPFPLAALVLLSVPATALAQGPSFDCARASTPDEAAICADPQLSELDRLIASAYARAHSFRPRIAQAMARNGLANRRACGADRACILDAQMALIGHYQQLGVMVALPPGVGGGYPAAPRGPGDAGTGNPDVIPEPPLLPSEGAAGEPPEQPSEGAVAALPQQVGQCANTAIATITDRFGEDVRANPDSGSAVTFANGGGQVSYDKVDALIQSQIGDPVMMCLVSVPQNCPPGDDRGKIYTTTNLRTQQSWSLPDSQHSCGGA
jgi:uncharacterized protein